MMNEHIIHAYEFDGSGGASSLENEAISKLIEDKRLAWVHFDASHPQTRQWLEKEISYLDPFVVEALLADETRPRVTEINEGLLVILRGVNLNKNAKPEDMVSIRLYLDSHRIISVQRRQLKATLDIEQKIKNKKGPKNAGQFLCLLIAQLIERMEPVLAALDESTDNIEEMILDNPDFKQRDDVISVRKKAILFRRYMAPQKEAIGFLKNLEIKWLDKNHKRHLYENYDRMARYVEDLDTIRERAQIIKDELANVLSDRLNKNMYVLSVIAAIFLPLGFLTGLLGINVGGIPGADDPYAFYAFGSILLAIVILQILLFKKLKWF